MWVVNRMRVRQLMLAQGLDTAGAGAKRKLLMVLSVELLLLRLLAALTLLMVVVLVVVRMMVVMRMVVALNGVHQLGRKPCEVFVLLFELHAPILEPNLDLSLCESQTVGYLNAPPAS